MADKSVKIDGEIHDMLQDFLSKKYSGKMYGKTKEAVNEAIKVYLDHRGYP